MLLPLSFLIRVNDTATHRQWLKDVATVLLIAQDQSGAIMDEVR